HVTALERRGLLDRGDDPDDGRAHRVALSRRGRRCLEQGASRRRAMIARALDGWSLEDREQLRMLLTRLHLDLQAHP
ncbi:MAG TPA: MarR family transcriptional regulator, partial [Nocardioidaceae bacterium]|nr:MarR family transcriptional regulator [Nocardioidaceae bacterium]